MSSYAGTEEVPLMSCVSVRRLAVEARRDPASNVGAIRRIADQLGIHPEALRGWVKKAEIDAPPT
uniref:hypothetical protein n=1 Tax=Paractinoplanes polyasparticus TaxID=2856853 RepID=UPI001C850D83|nr:hypothetical protein [Actinoplanes polyasparticus]